MFLKGFFERFFVVFLSGVSLDTWKGSGSTRIKTVLAVSVPQVDASFYACRLSNHC